jgi:hypothetical protein
MNSYELYLVDFCYYLEGPVKVRSYLRCHRWVYTDMPPDNTLKLALTADVRALLDIPTPPAGVQILAGVRWASAKEREALGVPMEVDCPADTAPDTITEEHLVLIERAFR